MTSSVPLFLVLLTLSSSQPVTISSNQDKRTLASSMDFGTKIRPSNGGVTPLPAGWGEKTSKTGRVYYENHVTRTTTWIRPTNPASYVTTRPRGKAPRDPNAPELREYNDGKLGYSSHEGFVQTYGPPIKVKDAKPITMTYEEVTERSFEKWGFAMREIDGIRRTFEIPNLLFSCEWEEDSEGPIFVHRPWPADNDDLIVRPLYPKALRGGGDLIKSNLGRVYVIDVTLPSHARRGYLAVEGLDMVETFLKSFHWRSRSEGYRNSDTDQGNHAPSFVVKDHMSRKNATGYYIAARPSTKNCGRIICHLEPIGFAKDALRRTGLVPAKGDKMLRDWVSNNFIDAQILLFD